jgi:hypothetical protein
MIRLSVPQIVMMHSVLIKETEDSTNLDEQLAAVAERGFQEIHDNIQIVRNYYVS